jgi:hypothetical protein
MRTDSSLEMTCVPRGDGHNHGDAIGWDVSLGGPRCSDVAENAYIHGGEWRGPEACGFCQPCPTAPVLVVRTSSLRVVLRGLQVL